MCLSAKICVCVYMPQHFDIQISSLKAIYPQKFTPSNETNRITKDAIVASFAVEQELE